MIKIFKEMPIGIKVSVLWLVGISLAAVFAGLLPIQDPLCQLNLPLPCADGITAGKWDSPNHTNFLGTDTLSRDTFARIIYGARVSLGAVLIGMTIGGTIGALVGYVQGRPIPSS